MGYSPVEQGNFETGDYEEQRAVIRQRIASCRAVIHIAGMRYGSESDYKSFPKGVARRSHAQMEFDLAHELKKQVHIIVASEKFPYDAPRTKVDAKTETVARRRLQEKHRKSLRESGEIYDRAATPAQLTGRVRKLRPKLAEIRSGTQRQRLVVAGAAAILLVLGLGIWLTAASGGREAAIAEARADVKNLAVAQREFDQELAARDLSLSEIADAEYFAELSRRTGLEPDRIQSAIETAGEWGEALLVKREHSRARTLFQQADPPLLLEAGLAAAFADDDEQAVADFDRALATETERGAALRFQAEALWNLGLLERANETAVEALQFCDRESDPKRWAQAQQLLGRILLARDLLDEAETAFSAADEGFADDPLASAVASHGLGSVHAARAKLTGDLGSLREAAEAFEKSLELRPGEDETRQQLGQIYLDLGSRTEGEEGDAFLTRAIEFHENQDSDGARRNLGLARLRLGQRRASTSEAEARKLLESASEALQLVPDAQNDLGLAQGALAGISQGEERQTWIRKSLESHRLAAPSFSDPEDLRQVSRTIGLTCQTLSEEAEAADAILDYARQAAEAFRAALEHTEKESLPQEWAETQSDLGDVLMRAAALSQGEDNRQLLAEAITAYEEAMQLPKAGHAWGQLGDALQKLAIEKRNSPEELPHLLGAIDAYEQALAEIAPDGRAEIQKSLAETLFVLGAKETDDAKARVSHYERAIKNFEACLSRSTMDAEPESWAGIQVILGRLLAHNSLLAELPLSADLTERSAAAYLSALSVRTQTDAPDTWAEIQTALALVLEAHGKRVDGPDGKTWFTRAAKALEESLKVYTRESHPDHWWLTQFKLGQVLSDEGFRSTGDEAKEIYARSAAAFELASQASDRNAAPAVWAEIEWRWGEAEINQGFWSGGESGLESIKSALVHFRAAETYYVKTRDIADWERNQQRIADALVRIANFTTPPDLALWQAPVAVYGQLRAHDPGNRHYYQRLAWLNHEVLNNFAAAFVLHESWNASNPEDNVARLDFAEAHFTTGRFEECVELAKQMQAWTVESGQPGEHIAMRILEILALSGLGDTAAASERLEALRAHLSDGAETFNLEWSWIGSRRYLETATIENLVRRRQQLLALIGLANGGNRDQILTALSAVKLE